MATAGDIVYFKAGLYTVGCDVQNSGTVGNYIVFSAYPGDEKQVVLDNANFNLNQKSYIKVSGFKIQNTSGVGIAVVGPCSNITISGNYTYNTVSSGISVWGVPWGENPGTYNNISNIIIESNKVEKACNGGWNECITLANGVVDFQIISNELLNGGDPIYGGEGIDVKEGCKNGIIYNNYIHNLTRRAIYLDGGGLLGFTPVPEIYNVQVFNNVCHSNGDASGMAIMTEGDGNVYGIEIYNNVFYNNGSDGLMFYKHPAGTGNIYDIKVVNNTFYGNGRYGILLNFSTAYNMVFRNNICYNNTNQNISYQSGSYTESNNLTATDPLFINPALANFRLGAGSPAINAGTYTDAPVYDILWATRVGNVDIGAFEYCVDSILSVSAPTTIEPNGSYDIGVSCETKTSRDIHVELQNTTTWVGYGGSVVTVNGGGQANKTVPFNVPGNLPANNQYRWMIYLTPVGANWIEAVTGTTSVYTDILSVDSILSVSAPTTIKPNGSYDIGVFCETKTSRDIHVELQNTTTWDGYGGSVVTVNGGGQANKTVPFTVPGNLPINDQYRWLIYLTPVSANWTEAVTGNTSVYTDILQRAKFTNINTLSMVHNLCYPNPFADFTSIRFNLDKPQHVRITVFSVTGQVIKYICNEDMSKGEHNVTWNGINMGNPMIKKGIYIIKIASPDIQQSFEVVYK